MMIFLYTVLNVAMIPLRRTYVLYHHQVKDALILLTRLQHIQRTIRKL